MSTTASTLRRSVAQLARENEQLRRDLDAERAANATARRIIDRLYRRVEPIDEIRAHRALLMNEIDRLTERLAHARAQQARCCYCGAPIPPARVACPTHRDLLKLDRAFAPRRGATTRSTTTAGPRTS